MTDWGKILMVVGVSLLVIGGLMWLGKLINLSLGQLPGDIQINRGRTILVIPLTTGLLICAVLALVFWLLRRRQ